MSLDTLGLICLGILACLAVIRDAQSRKGLDARPEVGTIDDPRVANMIVRQRAYGRRMRRQGLSLLSGKEYKPELTKPSTVEKRERSLYAIRGGRK